MNVNRSAILLASCLCSSAMGQTQRASQSSHGLSHVVLEVEVNGLRISSSGRLYRILSPAGRRTLVAEIDKDGKLTPSVTCTAQDRIMAEPDNVYAFTDDGPKTCREPVTFLYKMPIIKSADRDLLGNAGKLVEAGKFSQAQTIYSSVALRATKMGDYETARLANTASVALAAKQLNNKDWDKYVTRDPQQNYKLILSPEGVGKVKEFQEKHKITPTGVLDLKTQKALAGYEGTTGADIGTTPSFSTEFKR
ncbi:peptidoglycan-binding domain-containing protein [Paraburkholderia sp. BR10882]|uniref:peptidoglycan-binding domain-containing protein n=1 Tax=unclassified Paraburkholderia TaxID=2615204 RepID=UPI0034D00D56